MVMPTATMIRARLLIRFCNGVAGGLAPEVSAAMRPTSVQVRWRSREQAHDPSSRRSLRRPLGSARPTAFPPGRVETLLDRERLAGQGGFVDGKPLRADKAAVGWDSLALAEYEEVAGNDVLGRDQALDAGTDDGRMQRDGLAKRQNGSFSAQLLGEAEDAVQTTMAAMTLASTVSPTTADTMAAAIRRATRGSQT